MVWISKTNLILGWRVEQAISRKVGEVLRLRHGMAETSFGRRGTVDAQKRLNQTGIDAEKVYEEDQVT